MKCLDKAKKVTSAYISSCERYSECNLKDVFLETPDKILNIGMPRNDIFFKRNKELVNSVKSKVKHKLGIKLEDKIILYAPTFRDNNTDLFNIDVNHIIKACEKKFGGKFVFAFRAHKHVEAIFKQHSLEDVFYTNSYEDMQELILASDVIISDYSSCIWDVALASKPCFIFANDLSKYISDRGFYTPILDWPFPLAENNIDLEKNINNFNFEDYKIGLKRHLEELGSNEIGSACAQIGTYIINACK